MFDNFLYVLMSKDFFLVYFSFTPRIYLWEISRLCLQSLVKENVRYGDNWDAMGQLAWSYFLFVSTEYLQVCLKPYRQLFHTSIMN